jgi:pimeloyl-ACP methyl ester carboxylesterase
LGSRWEGLAMGIAQRTVTLDGRRVAYLEQGTGPLCLLIHGFPDDAWTWSRQLDAFSAAGLRVVAPFLPGFPPSDIPADGRCSTASQVVDLTALVRHLTDEPTFVVGHDWGALATQGLTATAPALVRRAVVVAASHPATLLSVPEMPAVAHHLFHIWLFQTDGIAEAAAKANDFALIDYLWELWTHDGHDDREHVDRLKREVLSRPGVIEALLSWYRSLVRMPSEAPDLVAQMVQPTVVPTLALWGEDDPARAPAAGEEVFFAGEYRLEVLAGAGHFVHRENPARFDELVLEWLSAETPLPG